MHMKNDAAFSVIAEVNPPELPTMTHRELEGCWDRVLITDNPFGTIRVSPYAYAARITHDVPSVKPTVVVSTRDRNIRAIESEVRGALGNGVRSFLVVVGDTVPEIDHLAHHHEIVEHLTALRDRIDVDFEVGMPTRMRTWQFRQRVDLGADFFVAGPVLDPAGVAENLARIDRRPDDPPIYVMVVPPVSLAWVQKAESYGAIPASEAMKAALAARPGRGWAWDQTTMILAEIERAGGAGAIITGLKFETVVGEASAWCRALPQLTVGDRLRSAGADPAAVIV
jgi:5,10-methylenetetrahydrofolate reductase